MPPWLSVHIGSFNAADVCDMLELAATPLSRATALPLPEAELK
jgi:hypothetical protein